MPEVVDLTRKEIEKIWFDSLAICTDPDMKAKSPELLGACTASVFQTKLGKKVAEKKS